MSAKAVSPMSKQGKIRKIVARVAELVILLAIIKNGPMSIEQLRNHWSINKLSLPPALNRLMEKGDISLVNGKFRPAGSLSHILPPYLQTEILLQNEVELVNLASTICYLGLLEVGLPKIIPIYAWAGQSAPCTKQSWPYVARTLSMLGLAPLLDSSVLNWQTHPAFNNQSEEEEE